jgi:hypothetical protein
VRSADRVAQKTVMVGAEPNGRGRVMVHVAYVGAAAPGPGGRQRVRLYQTAKTVRCATQGRFGDMKRWLFLAALCGAVLVTNSSAWSQVNLSPEQAPPEQIGVSKIAN